jgi:hypothetical protein
MNFGAKPVRIPIQIETYMGGRLQKVYPPQSVNIPARQVIRAGKDNPEEPQEKDQPGEFGVTFDISEFDDRNETIIRGRLPDHKDAFGIDDEAWLVVGVVRKSKVLIVGRTNTILDAFFDDDATKEVATVTKIMPDQLRENKAYIEPARVGEYDLVIFDRCAPMREDEMPRANTVFIGRPPPPWSMDNPDPKSERKIEKVDTPTVKGWTGEHGLLRYLTGLHEIGISEAIRIHGLPPRTPRIMEGDGDLGLMLALNRGAYTDVVMCFSILTDTGEWNTNWPLLPSFPLFWRNVLYTLGNIRDATGDENLQPGQVKLLRPDGKVQSVTVTDTKGDIKTLQRGTRPDFAYGDTERCGVYRAEWENGVQRFSVNLLDSDESSIEPRPSVQIGAESIAAGETRKQPRELWKFAVLAGLLFLILEWYVYNRRVFV